MIVEKKRNTYVNTFKKEIFSVICSILIEGGFSKRKTYIMLKRKFFRSYVLAQNIKSVNLKLKLSRYRFKVLNNTTTLNGFYYAK